MSHNILIIKIILLQMLHIFNKQKLFFIAGIIFMLNFCFKLINITHDPIWYDECFSIFYAQQTIPDILHVSTWEPPPPLFNIGLYFWIKLFGISELSVRLLPTLISSFTGVVLYLFLKRFTTNRIAITASVLFLFSNISFYYAHEVRCYSFALLVSIVSIWLFIELLIKPTYILSLCLGLSYYILIMTHYLTFFILLFQGILFLIFINKTFFKYYLISVLSFMLLLAHWVPRIIEVAQGGGGNNHWLKSPSSDQLVEFLFNINNGSVQLYILGILACAGIVSAFIKKEILLPNKATQAIFIYSIFISIPTVLLSFFISSSIPIFLDRYLLFTLGGFIIFFSICISHLPVKNIFYYSLLGIIGIYALTQISINKPIAKMDYRNAINYVKTEQDSSSIIFLQTIDVGSLFAYYYDKAIFKKYMNLENSLKEKNVFMGNDATKIPVFNDSIYTKVIHVETFSEFADPNKTVEAWFNKNGYKKVKLKDDYVGVKVTTYQKQ